MKACLLALFIVANIGHTQAQSDFTLCTQAEDSGNSEVWIKNDQTVSTAVNEKCICLLSSKGLIFAHANNISLAITGNHCDEEIVIKLPNITDPSTFTRCSHVNHVTHEGSPLSIFGESLEIIYTWKSNEKLERRGQIAVKFYSLNGQALNVKCLGQSSKQTTSGPSDITTLKQADTTSGRLITAKIRDTTSKGTPNEKTSPELPITPSPKDPKAFARKEGRNKHGFPLQTVIIAAVVPSVILILVIVIIIVIILFVRKKRRDKNESAGAVAFDNTVYGMPQISLADTAENGTALPNGDAHVHVNNVKAHNDTDSDVTTERYTNLPCDKNTETSLGHVGAHPIYEKISDYHSDNNVLT